MCVCLFVSIYGDVHSKSLWHDDINILLPKQYHKPEIPERVLIYDIFSSSDVNVLLNKQFISVKLYAEDQYTLKMSTSSWNNPHNSLFDLATPEKCSKT